MSMESQHGIHVNWDILKCPFCKSLFRVDKKDMNSMNYCSFSCLHCKKIFWACRDNKNKIEIWKSKPVFQQEPTISNDEKICHNCLSTLKKGVEECYHCGKSFYDSTWRKKAPYSSYRLRKSFENLIDSYHSAEEHLKFSKLCIQEKNIPFAVHCYGCFLKVRPGDKKASQMLKYLSSIVDPPSEDCQHKVNRLFSYMDGWIHAALLFFFIGSVTALIIAYSLPFHR